MIGDVGQGATFRGQQALLEGASRARTQATSAAQQQIAELDELAKARQLNEMAQLKQQQQQNRMATAQLVAGIVGGGTEIAAGIAGSEEAGKHQKAEREIALLTAQENADKARAALEKKILNKVSDTPTSIPDYVESLEGYTEPIIPRITPEDPVLEVESFGPKTLKWGVMTPVLDESNTIVGFTFVSNKGKEGIMPNANVTLEQSLAEYAKGVE